MEKIDLLAVMKIWNECKGDLKQIAERLGITQQIPGLIASIKPETMAMVGQFIGQYIPQAEQKEPPTAAEVAAEVVKILPPSLQNSATGPLPPEIPLDAIVDAVKGQISAMLQNGFQVIHDTEVALANSIKALQDGMPVTIEKQISTRWQLEREAAQKEFNERVAAAQQQQAGPANPNQGGGQQYYQPPANNGPDMIDKLLAALPVIADAWSKFKPAPATNMAEMVLSSYVRGMTTGNKLRIGEAKPEDTAKELLGIIAPDKDK
jgi:hypothetical protein